jgi:hypothetical protein
MENRHDLHAVGRIYLQECVIVMVPLSQDSSGHAGGRNRGLPTKRKVPTIQFLAQNIILKFDTPLN